MKFSSVVLALSLVILIPSLSYAAHLNSKALALLNYETNVLLQAFEIAESQDDVMCYTRSVDETKSGADDDEENYHILTLKKLKGMINRVGKTFKDARPGGGPTYLFVPKRDRKLYRSKHENHAEDNMIKDPNYDLSTIDTIWLLNSPCPKKCAPGLIKAFKGKQKPKIHVAHFYQGEDTPIAKKHATSCLARMIKEEFSIVPWDWNAFKLMLDEQQCKDAIDEAINNSDKFKRGMSKVEARLEDVHQDSVSKSKDQLEQECPDVDN